MAITKENKYNVAKFNVVPLTSPALMDFPGLKGLNVKQRTLHMSMQHPHLAPKDVVQHNGPPKIPCKEVVARSGPPHISGRESASDILHTHPIVSHQLSAPYYQVIVVYLT